MGMNIDVNERLQAIYAKIPGSRCVEGCNECCGPIYVSKTELANLGGPIKKYLDKEFKTAPEGCHYLVDGQCSVYENRPFICRIFGVAPETEGLLKCNKGSIPERVLSRQEFDMLWSAYRRLSFIDNDNADPKNNFIGGYWLDGTPRTILGLEQRLRAMIDAGVLGVKR